MDPAIVVAIAVFAPVTLAVLALRFGSDSRPQLQSPEQIQASWGMSWYGAPSTGSRPPQERRIVLARSSTASGLYPTLDLLDSARRPGVARFATDPNARTLERHARRLADELWSDHVWLTGLVSPAQLSAVIGPLEAERQRGLDAVRVLVATEPATAEQPILA